MCWQSETLGVQGTLWHWPSSTTFLISAEGKTELFHLKISILNELNKIYLEFAFK